MRRLALVLALGLVVISGSTAATSAPPLDPDLVAAYTFDEGTGTTAADASGGGNAGTVAGAAWIPGKTGTALSFDGIDDWVTVADAAALDLTTGMTVEAWVRPSRLTGSWRTVVIKEATGNLSYALYASGRTGGVPSGHAFVASDVEAQGTQAVPIDAWTHLATTYDGAAVRLYLNGALVSTEAAAGSIQTSAGVLRIGGNAVWDEFFAGAIDDVRIYRRPLAAAEIQADMATPVMDDTSPPAVKAITPAAGSGGADVATKLTIAFGETMDAATVSPGAFELRDGSGTPVPLGVAFDPVTATATLTPASVLAFATTYTATVLAGGARDLAGNTLAADHAWTFTTEALPPPILVVTSPANPFSRYYEEILRTEGLNAFRSAELSTITPAFLAYFGVVVLGEMPLTPAQVTMLADWVSTGGNLVAMRPDKQLAGLLGLTDAASTLAEGYLLVDTTAGAGAGLVAETIQFHGTADRYTLNGASEVAALYADATTPAGNPAVTLHDVGAAGGQAAAFTYDLARSVALTRQGNPAWAGQDRDGIVPIRPNDLFYGGTERDWVDVTKLAIPQADEQQRLLANLILRMNLDRQPLPRFWYLPRGEKAAIVMTGDDHAIGGTAGRFQQYVDASAAGCSVADWECVRSTSYVYPSAPLTPEQAATYTAAGFEVALHPWTNIQNPLQCANWTPDALADVYETQLADFAAAYPGAAPPLTSRTHCVAWSDYVTQPKIQRANGIRLDTNYYAYPASWIGAIPGFMTGSGLVQRFADLDGTPIDVFQATTHMNDEAGQSYPQTVDALLDGALGPQGFYAILTTLMHTDQATSAGSDAIVAAAQARGVPIVSARQLLEWLDGRNGSSFGDFSWTGSTLSFGVAVGAGAGGLQAMLPTASATGTLGTITRDGAFVPYATETIKGVEYAIFAAVPGTYAAAYDAAGVPQVVATSPADAATGEGLDTVVQATFSVALDETTIDATSFTLEGADGSQVPSTVAWDAVRLTATLTPGAPLANGETYTARLATTVRSSTGQTLSNPVSWSFTTGPPTVTGRSPAAGATAVARSTDVEVEFSRAMDAATLTGSSFTLTRVGGPSPVAATVTYDATTRTATLDPAVSLDAGAQYEARVETTVTGADGLSLAAPVVWTFTTSTCPCTLFPDTLQPQFGNLSTTNGRDPAGGPWSLELGVKFRVDAPMALSAVRFYKDPNETGAHTGTVWTAAGTKLAEVAFANETASGWQHQALSVPLQLDAGATYVVSVNASTAFVQTHEGLLAEVVSGPLRSIADGQNGVYADAAGVFPTNSHRQSNYFTDVEVIAPGDVPPPAVESTDPADGAVDVDRNTTVSARFTRPVDPATVAATSFTLRRTSDGAPVTAAVSYDADQSTAELVPDAPLDAATGYTATLTTDIASLDGKHLAAPVEWSFTVEDSRPVVRLAIPTGGADDVGSGVTPRAEFTQPLDPATVTGSAATLTGPGGPVPATVSYDAARQAVVIDPSGPLAHGATYTATVAASVAAADGTPLGTPYTWAFAVAASEPGPPTVDDRSPADGAGAVSRAASVTATFSRSMDPSTLSTASFTVTAVDSATPVSASVSYDSLTKTATLTPDAELPGDRVFTAALDTTVQAADGTPLAASVSWTFSTSACPCTLFPSTATPASVNNGTAIGRPLEGEPYSLELGVKLTVDTPTELIAVRFYKDNQETGGHTATLWSGDGELVLAQVPFTSETFSGWQEQALASPVTLEPGNVYVLSVNGNAAYSVTLNGLATEIVAGPLRTVADGANGVFADAGGQFPTDTFASSNYFVDARVMPSSAQVAPSVLQQMPAELATGVARSTTVRARFSRPVDQATLDATTFTLRRPDGSLFPAAISYEPGTNTAVLTPSALLAFGTTYTATLTTGVTASDGIALGTPVSWTFTTLPAPPAVTSTTPADGSIGIPAGVAPAATFSRDMDPLTITAASFTLTKAGAAGPVAASVSYDASSRTATLVPGAALDPSSTYTARLETAITDVDGVPLAAAHVWTFDTSGDSTPPETTIGSAPGDPSASAAASFTFTSSEPGGTFECKLDAAAYAPCTSPVAYAALADGAHTFSVRATDAAGNTDPTPAAHSWTVDTVAPAATIDSASSGTVPSKELGSETNETSATFAFSSPDPAATFECSLDGTPFAACTSPRTYLGPLDDVGHTFSVRATDPAGNTGPAATYSWAVDTDAPAVTLTGAPAALTSSAGASFSFASEPDATFECSLDGVPYAPCLSPVSYGGLADGAHTFSVRATDAAGNTGAPADAAWTVDTVPPAAAVDAGPDDPTSDVDARFAFSAEPGATFECALDGGGFAACSSPKTYAGPLADGAHTFEVRATDAAGNTGPAGVHLWAVDTVAPAASIDSGPDAVTNQASATFALSVDEPGARLEASLDGAPFADVAATAVYGPLADGPHTFAVRAVDDAGNTGATAAFAWTIDTVAPAIAITSGPADPTAATSASFAFSSEPGASLACRLDAEAYAPCASPRDYAGPLADGAHAFTARATDAAGNAAEAGHAWVVDTTGPETVVDGGPADPTNATAATFSFSSDEAGSTFECELDAGPWAPCASPAGYASLAEGAHAFRVRAVDALGNADATPAAFAWTIDLSAPAAPAIASGPSDPTSSTSASFAFTSEPGATFACSLDGGPLAPCASPQAYAALGPGPHSFSVAATDAAGNTGAAAVYEWDVDTTPPAAPVLTLAESAPTSHADGGTLYYNASGANSASFDVLAATGDPETGIAEVAFPAIGGLTGGGADASSPYESTYTWTAATIASGPQTVTARNGVDLTSAAAFTLVRDVAAPTGGSISYVNGYVTTPSVAVAAATGGDGSGSGVNAAGAVIERDAAALAGGVCAPFADAWTPVTSPDTTVASGTCYRYRYAVPDNVGNVATYTSASVVKVDATAPSAPALTLTESDPEGHVAGTTLYYRAAGSFTVAAATGDAESAIGKVNFAKPAGMTISPSSGDDTTAPYSATLTWASGTTASGAHAVTATNGAALTSASAFTVTKDTAGPAAFSLTEPLAAAKIRNGQVLSASPTDALSGVAGVQFRYCSGGSCSGGILIATDTTAPYSITWSSMPADGQYTLLARATDNVGNVTDSATATVTIDNTPPTTLLGIVEGTSPDRQHFREGVFYYNPAAGGDFRMLETVVDAPAGVQKVDFPSISGVTGFSGSASTDTTAPYESSVYSFTTANTTAPTQRTVVTTDNANNKQTDTISFSRDTTPPAAFAVAAAPVLNEGASVSASPTDAASGVGQVEFRYCAGATCTYAASAQIATDLTAPFEVPWTGQPADGTYTLLARATDNVGNLTDSATLTVTVDNTAATPAITDGPSDPTNATSAAFSFTGGAGDALECRLDGGAFAACSSPHSYAGPLADGLHTFEVRATDGVGNTSPAAAYGWTVDTASPDTTIGSAADDPTNATSATFSFASEPGTTFRCRLDDGPFEACESPVSYAGPLADGEHTFSVEATDSAGNVDPTPASHAWTIDTVAPAPAVTSAPEDPTGATDAAFGFTAEPGAVVECRLDGGAWEACTSPHAYAGPLAEGAHTFEVRATDAAGNTGSAVHGWTIDLSGPAATIAAAPADPTNATAASFSFSSEPGAEFECRLDEGVWEACASPRAYPGPLADGPHAFEVRATDAAGNTGPAATHAWTVDTVAPAVTVADGPADPTNAPGASFAFASEPGAELDCRLDGGAWAACTSPHAYAGPLTEGAHTFDVRATDAAGNAGTAGYEWTIDLTPPATTIDAAPADPTNVTSTTFGFSSEPGASFQCRLDGSAWTACTSPRSYAGPLADGSHTFEVQATDAAGNTDPTPAVRTWTIDTVAQAPTITGGPDDPTNATSASFSFSGPSGASLRCRLDGGAWAACSSPQDYAGPLADGSHAFEVEATDAAGNSATADYVWTVDTVAPGATITSAPDDPTNATSAAFEFASEAGAAFACRLDGAPWAVCTSPSSYAGPLADGDHTFEVQATDAAGNTDPTPAIHAWTVDTVAPAVTVTGAPADPTNATSATFAFSSEAGAELACRLDGGAWEACASPQSYPGPLADGVHTFEARATDQAGNTGAAAAGWTIDTLAPETTIADGPAGLTNATGASFEFGSEPGASFECRLDGAAWEACTSPRSYAGPLADGSHTFEVRATDAAGNADPSPAARTWTVDTVAPAAIVTSGPAALTSHTTASFEFTSEAGASFECKLDGELGFSPCASPHAYLGPLMEGPHTFSVRAVDAAGNSGDAAVHAWTVDTTPPTATITSQPPDPAAETAASFAFSSTDPSATFTCRLDGGPGTACTSPSTYMGPLADGGHTFEVAATDAAGNTGGAATYSWTVDTTAPTTTISAGPADPTSSTSASFTFGASEPGAAFECSLDGAGYGLCQSVYMGLADGAHTFDVRATDAAGNTGPAARHAWTVDTTAPTTILAGTPADPTNVTSATFAFMASETGSTSECLLDDGAWTACSSPHAYGGPLAEGSHTFSARSRDAAGNLGPPATYVWSIDTSGPSATIESQPADPTSATDATFTFSSDDGAAQFECRLDGGGWAACSSPRSYAGPLADGGHTFDVRAADSLGNSGAGDSYSWTVDTQAPALSIDSAPAAATSSTAASFSFGSTDPTATFECKLDAGSYASCTSPASYGPLADGDHSFSVRATDPAGNHSTQSRAWTLDTVAPTVAITDRPADPTSSTDASFAFSASELGVTLECKLDAGAWDACSSPQLYAGPLADGSHTFQTKATDAAGNAGAAAVHSWTVDTVAPAASITGAPADPTNATTAELEFTANEASTFECRLDGGGWAACTSPKAYSSLGDGSHSASVRPTDAAGNTGAALTHTWTVDTVAPVTTIVAKPADPSNDASPSFSFSANEASTFECRLDGGSWAACASPKAYSGLADGPHTFSVRAKDAAENAGAGAAYTWVIDTVAPETTITSAPPDPANSTNADFAFGASETGSSFQCRLDGAAWAGCTSPQAYADLPEGAHTFDVRATDAAGNVDATPAAHAWRVALIPEVTNRAPADGATDVGPLVQPTATFSRPLDPATLAAGFTLERQDGTPVAATVAWDAATSTATLAPGAVLAGSTTYVVRLATTITSSTGTPLGAPVSWSFTTIAPPTIVAASPSDGATGIDHGVRPTATFSRAIDPATAGSIGLVDAAGSPVQGNIAYDGATLTATFVPYFPLGYSARYTLTVGTALRAADGSPLAAAWSASFTTSGAGSAARVDSGGTSPYTSSSGDTFAGDVTVSGSMNVSGGGLRTVGSAISGTADQALYQSERYGLFLYTFVVPNGSYRVRLHFADTRSTASGQNVFHMDLLESAGTDLYALDVFASAGGGSRALVRTVDVATTTNSIRVRSYRSVGEAFISAIEVLPLAPEVASTTPAAGATSVARSTTVRATFSRAIDPASLSFALSGPAGPAAGTVTYDAGTRTATFTPSAALASRVTYEAQVSAVGADGMVMSAPYSWSFTTAK